MTTGTAPSDFAKRLDQTAEDTETLLAELLSDALLPDEIARPKRLIEAMRYSSLGGGKRLRPFLVVESSAVFGVARKAALLAGAALECIHCYSLIHDDLPAMDNSDLRRGRPTLHKAYDDATAILAGDALLTLAFDIISRDEIHREASVRLLLTRALARASGVGGMVGGQILDLAGEGRFGDREPVDVARLQQMKTGALLHFGCIAGAILGQSSPKEHQALDDYGRALGDEPRAGAQHVTPGAEDRERRIGARQQIAHALLGALDPELGDEGGLAQRGVLSGHFAERRRIALDIEQIVG
ncbi:MAG TPA: polyprenyl synthetase family protein, partial [Bradyrhizobium sp.]|nr:polyprenyl synthetase family protein [Bradyrhizobium sp.]